MMRVVAFAVMLSGCVLDPPARDGEPCRSDTQCASNYCDYGYCRGSDCSDSPDTCLGGWTCIHYDGGILFADSDTCQPLCAACPLNSSCPAGAAPTDTCSTTPPPNVVSVTASVASAMTGEDVTFSVTASSPRGAIATYAWSFGDGNAPVEGTTTQTHAFADAGMRYARVGVTDDVGVTTEGFADVQVCGTVGTRCEFHDDCCSGDCDVFGTNTCITP